MSRGREAIEPTLRSICLLGSLLLAVADGGGADAAQAVSAESAVARYTAERDAIARGESQDYGALRRAYLALPDLLERSLRLAELEGSLLSRSEPERTGELASEILELNYASPVAHLMLMQHYHRAGDTTAADRHERALSGTLRVIRASGDGSLRAPYTALSIQEAELFLSLGDFELLGELLHPRQTGVVLSTVVRSTPDSGTRALHFDLTRTYEAALAAVREIQPGLTFSPAAFVQVSAAAGLSPAICGWVMHAMGADASEPALRAYRELLERDQNSANLIGRELLGAVYLRLSAHEHEEDAARLRDRALDLLLPGAELNSPLSVTLLAEAYFAGHLPGIEAAEIVTLLARAADREDPVALMLLAEMYALGRAVEADQTRADELLRRAARAGLDEAVVRHALRTFDGEPAPEIAFEALGWLRESVAHEHGPALFYLGLLHARGEYVTADHAAAVGLWRRITVQNNPPKLVNEVAWRLATSDAATLRDAPHAVRVMRELLALHEGAGQSPEYLDTLAAALAASGEFEEAVRVQQETLLLAAGRPELATYRQHLAHFENHEVLRYPLR